MNDMRAPEFLAADLREAALPPATIDEWFAAEPRETSEFGEDRRLFAIYWALGDGLIARLPRKSHRNPAEMKAAAAIRLRARSSRETFLAAYAEKIYATLTRDSRASFVLKISLSKRLKPFPG